MRISFFFLRENSSSYFPTELLDVARLYFPGYFFSPLNSARYAKEEK